MHCVGSSINNLRGSSDWNACVRGFDTENFADQIASTGAGYVIFTMMLQTKHLIAPNDTYNRLTKYKPGEACSDRDLVSDLYDSLHKRGIPLILYWTGDGPRKDPQASNALQYADGTPLAFVQNWASVAKEYGERYKEKVAGWWVDGCYAKSGYDDQKWTVLANALRAGNPSRIIALNDPQITRVNSANKNDDFTTGEQNSFTEIPTSRWRDGAQWHTLSYLGDAWASPGLRYKPEALANYVRQCSKVGGVVSIDVCLYRDGQIETSHLACLRAMKHLLQ